MKITKKFKENVLLVVIGVVLFWALFNYELMLKILGHIVSVLKPVLLGAVLAFILNVPMSGIEKHWFKEPKKPKAKAIANKLKRPMSIVLTLLIFLGVVTLVCWLVIPALIRTFTQLTSDIPVLVNNLTDRLGENQRLMDWISKADINTDAIVKKITNWLKDGVEVMKTLDSTVSVLTTIFSSIVNIVLGVFFAVYMLAQKEKLKRQSKKIASAFLPENIVGSISKVCRRTIEIFGKFFVGQSTEAVILGSLCAIGMSIFGFPNVMIISVLVACTALIPIVGAFLGFAVGFLLICVTSFKMAIWYLIFMLILQQVEGNLIYPRVVGGSVGLPALWTLFAITVGGNMFGIIGMFMSVPVFSVIYVTFSEIVTYRNKKRERFEISENENSQLQK